MYRETALLMRQLLDTRAKLKALMEQQEAAPGQLRALAAREAAALAQLKLAAEREETARDDLVEALAREKSLEGDLQKARNEGTELGIQLRRAEQVAGKAERARDELAEQLAELQDEPSQEREKLVDATRRAVAAEQRADALANKLTEEQARSKAQVRTAPPAQTQPSPSKALEKARAELRAAKERIGELAAELKRARTATTKPAQVPIQASPSSEAPVSARRRGKTSSAEQERLQRENNQLRTELLQARQAGAAVTANLHELQKRIAAVETTRPRPQQTSPLARWRVPETEEDPELRRRIDAALRTGYEPSQDRLVKSLVSLYRTEHELARWQEQRGLPVTVQRIRPGTDLLMIAFCEAMQLRSDYPMTLRPSQYRQHIDRANWPFHLDAQAELEIWQATIRRRAALEIAMGREG